MGVESHLDELHQARMQSVKTKTFLKTMEITKTNRATAEILRKAKKKQGQLLDEAVNNMIEKKVEKHFQCAQKQARKNLRWEDKVHPPLPCSLAPVAETFKKQK